MAFFSVPRWTNTSSGVEQAQMQTVYTTFTQWTEVTTTIEGVPQYPVTTVYTTLQPVSMASYPDPIMSATGSNLQSLLSERRTRTTASNTTFEASEPTAVVSSLRFPITTAMESSRTTGITSTDIGNSTAQVSYTTGFITTTTTTLCPIIGASLSRTSTEPFALTSVAPSVPTVYVPSPFSPSFTSPSPVISQSSVPTSYAQPPNPTSFEPFTSTALGPSTTTHDTPIQTSIEGSTSIPRAISTVASSSPAISAVVPPSATATTIIVIPTSLITNPSTSITPTVNIIIPLTPSGPVTLITSRRIARNEPTIPTEAPSITQGSTRALSQDEHLSPTILLYGLLPSFLVIKIVILIVRLRRKPQQQDSLPYTTKTPQPSLGKRLSLSVNIRRLSDTDRSIKVSEALHVTGNAVSIGRTAGKGLCPAMGGRRESRDGEVRRTPSGLSLDI